MKTDKKCVATIADEQIIDMFWNRNEKAIRETDNKYGRFLFRIAYNILNDRLDCEECQNDTYLAIWNAIPPNRPNMFSMFIAKIIRNTAIKKYKEKSRKKRIPSEMVISIDEFEEILHSSNSTEEEYSSRELGKLINDYIGTLNERQQYIFIGRFYMGDKLEIIAYELGIHASTVHREIEKIKINFRLYLKRNGENV